MKIPFTLSVYISRQFLLRIGIALAIVVALIIITDAVELIRRGADKDIPFSILMEMVLLRLPRVVQEIIPFGVLLGAILCFSRLTQTNELIVARAAGVSVWQFLAPALITAAIIGVVMTTLFNPLSSAVFSRFERLEGKYFRGKQNTLAVSDNGIWLRETDNATKERTIIHAARVSHDSRELYDVMFLYSSDNLFTHRIDADKATLQEGRWYMENAVLTAPEKIAEKHNEYVIPTTIALEQLQDSFAAPESISFWELPHFIRTLQATGFSALRHRLHWHTLMVAPFLLCAMVIIAASVSLRPPRRGKAGMMIVLGIMIGFVIYYLTGLVSALGQSGSIPVVLAAWIPVLMSLVVGTAFMLHVEDG
jgi:lipopolysaccharide export system permease protein